MRVSKKKQNSKVISKDFIKVSETKIEKIRQYIIKY